MSIIKALETKIVDLQNEIMNLKGDIVGLEKWVDKLISEKTTLNESLTNVMQEYNRLLENHSSSQQIDFITKKGEKDEKSK